MRVFGRNIHLPWVKNEETSGLANPSEWFVRMLLRQLALSGVNVTPLRALGVATVYACVNVTARTMSTLPVKLQRELPAGGFVNATEHYLYSLVKDEPNDDMTSAAFRRAVQANATLRKAGYALINRNGLGEVAELVPIEFCDIREEQLVPNGPIVYKLKDKVVSSRDLLIINGLTFNGICGMDMLSIAKECIGLAIALQDNASRFFGNGSRPGGTLEHPMTLSQEAQDRLREQIETKVKGPDNAWNLMILEEGLKYVAQRSDNDSAQFNESRVYQDKAIARHFCIPQHKVGILDNAKFNNIEQENTSYVTDAMLPWVTQWEQEMNRKLLSKEERAAGYGFKFNLEGLLRGDIKTRYESYSLGRQWGWLCADEIREKEDMNPLPEGKGKIYLQPSNMVPAGTPPPEPKPSNTPPPNDNAAI